MKKVIDVESCLKCPHNVKIKHLKIKELSPRRFMMAVCDETNNIVEIYVDEKGYGEEDEYRCIYTSINNYTKFPDWCPLKDKEYS